MDMHLVCLLHLICLFLCHNVSTGHDGAVKRRIVYLLGDSERGKYFPVSVDEVVTVRLKKEIDYYPINIKKSVFCVFYVTDNNYDEYIYQYGLRLHWEDFYSSSCFEMNSGKPPWQIGPTGSVCSDKVNLQTIQNVPTGLVNISYSGTPHNDRFMLSLVPYKARGSQGCGTDFVECTDSNGTICIRKSVCNAVHSCNFSGTCGQNPSTDSSTKDQVDLPLGFIGAISGLVITGFLFLIGVLVWYRCKRRRQPPEEEKEESALQEPLSPQGHLETLRVQAPPNEYITLPKAAAKENDATILQEEI